MAYTGNLSAGQQIYIENRGVQTLVTVVSSSVGQQQSQSSAFESGQWNATPKLLRTSDGFVLQIESVAGQHFIQLQANGFSSLVTAPSLHNADVVPLQHIADTTSSHSEPITPKSPLKMEPMKPMEPLPPLKMGDMEMRLNPMEMRMGDIELRMGGMPNQVVGRFCTQCGQPVKESDRFCASCGHRLLAED